MFHVKHSYALPPSPPLPPESPPLLESLDEACPELVDPV
jgi:hypothetical protein